jgi:hypothetical protein
MAVIEQEHDWTIQIDYHVEQLCAPVGGPAPA